MRPDGTAERSPVSELISAVARRQWWRQAAVCVLFGAAVFLLLAALTVATLPTAVRAGTAIAAAAAALMSLRTSITRRAAAAAIERRQPSCRNLVITAEELERHPERTSARVVDRVTLQASTEIRGVSSSAIVPGRQIALPLGAAMGLVAIAFLYVSRPAQNAIAGLSGVALPADAAARAVRVLVAPPAYTGRPLSTLTNPARIDAVEGSRIRFELADGWRVRFGSAEPAAESVARASGYFAVEPIGRSGERVLIPLNVQPDRTPSVRITAPAKDLLLADASRSIPVSVSASDDLGLQALEVRYTRVSGSGEHFEFVEGTLPAAVRRTSGTEWQADASLALASLRLGPGDSLVYRAVARDERPGDAGVATSDTYFIEIAGPGQIALEGVDMPPELDRYAMSQQMIVVKLERLRKEQSRMSGAALAEEAASLAAEQRTVRANFIFLLGGHVEDEEEEAAQSHEIQEGRLENTARRDINAAISYMTRAEQRITALEIGGALPPARAAVESLQRAFGRSRYLLRSLAVRGRLDPSRRLTGDLAGAGGWRRTVTDPAPSRTPLARAVLAMLLESIDQLRDSQDLDARRLLDIAELALKIDPTATVWQNIARDITHSRDVPSLERLAALVSNELLSSALPRTGLSATESPLERAFREEHRR
jgi:hypothetical protein